jgi:hypothetical protein
MKNRVVQIFAAQISQVAEKFTYIVEQTFRR